MSEDTQESLEVHGPLIDCRRRPPIPGPQPLPSERTDESALSLLPTNLAELVPESPPWLALPPGFHLENVTGSGDLRHLGHRAANGLIPGAPPLRA